MLPILQSEAAHSSDCPGVEAATCQASERRTLSSPSAKKAILDWAANKTLPLSRLTLNTRGINPLGSSCLYRNMYIYRRFPKLGLSFGRPHNKDYSIAASIFRVPLFWETTMYTSVAGGSGSEV